MIEIDFLGVGEALDGENLNASFLLSAQSKLLIDCGFAIPSKVFSLNWSPELLDGVYLTHFHADHIFGLPALLLDLSTRRRAKPLTLISQPGLRERVELLCSLAYPSLLKSITYELQYIETLDPLEWNELRLEFAETEHTLRNMAVRIDIGAHRVGFSGDGNLTEATRGIFQSCTALIHESYSTDQEIPNHACAPSLISFASSLQSIELLALVHLRTAERRANQAQLLRHAAEMPFEFIIPAPGHRISLA